MSRYQISSPGKSQRLLSRWQNHLVLYIKEVWVLQEERPLEIMIGYLLKIQFLQKHCGNLVSRNFFQTLKFVGRLLLAWIRILGFIGTLSFDAYVLGIKLSQCISITLFSLFDNNENSKTKLYIEEKKLLLNLVVFIAFDFAIKYFQHSLLQK